MSILFCCCLFTAEDADIPSDVLDYEKEIFNSLARLYSSNVKVAPETRMIRYGGEEHILSGFHYRSNSTFSDSFNKKGPKRMEYIDVNEDAPIIYRWEVKGALATQTRNKSGKFQHRVFTPFTVYKSAHVADQYICLATMNVRCATRRFDFLMKKVGSTQTAEMWQGLDKIKHFYACPHISVDHGEVKRDRFLYWDSWQHIYKEDRLVLLDTRYPSNKNLPAEKLELVQDRFQQWKLYPGRLKAHEPSMLEADTLLASRAARKLEEQQQAIMQASLKKSRELEALIESHEGLQPSKEDKKAKKSKTSRKVTKGTKKPKVKSNKKVVLDIGKDFSPTAANAHTNAAMQQQIDQLLAALAAEKKKTATALRATNSFTSVVPYQEEKDISPPSKRIADLEKATREEDLKLALVAKKRKVAEEEEDLQQLKAAKKKLKLESMSYASQLIREGELERVKLKVQADQIQADHAQREQKRAEEDRRRQTDFEDSKRRQQMQFTADEHAVMIEKERARIKNRDSITQHNNMLQMVALSTRHHDLAVIMKHATPQQDCYTDSAQKKQDGRKKAPKSTSSSSSLKNESASSSEDAASIVADLKRQLKDERNLQENLKKGVSDLTKYAEEDSSEDSDSSDEEEDDDGDE